MEVVKVKGPNLSSNKADEFGIKLRDAQSKNVIILGYTNIVCESVIVKACMNWEIAKKWVSLHECFEIIRDLSQGSIDIALLSKDNGTSLVGLSAGLTDIWIFCEDKKNSFHCHRGSPNWEYFALTIHINDSIVDESDLNQE